MQHAKFTLRRATKNDNATIAQLSVLCWQQSYRGIFTPDFLAQLEWEQRATGRKKFCSENKIVTGFIAEIAEQAIGFCDVGPARMIEDMPIIDRSFGEIYAIYVLREFQKQGIGLALFKAACEYLINHGFARCIIWTLKENQPAIAFYNAIGCIHQTGKKVFKIDDKQHTELAFTIDLE